MLLILDIEVIEYFSLLGFGLVRVSGLRVEFAFPEFNFTIFLLNQFDEVFVFVDKMSVLGKQKFNFFFQIIDFLTLSDLEKKFLVDSNQLCLELSYSSSPIFHIRGTIRKTRGRVLSSSWARCSGIALIGGVVLPTSDVVDRAVSHV